MKKGLAWLLTLVLALSLCACGSTGNAKPAEAEAPAKAQEPAGKPETSTGAPEKTEDTPKASEPLAYTIADEVLVDDETCTFTIKKARVDPLWGFTLEVFCENKTSDKTLMFSMDGVSINGYMEDPFWAKEVAPGKMTNEDVSFSSTLFEDLQIASADEIRFTLKVYDSEDWGADDFVNDVFTVYPTGLTADRIVCPERRTTAAEQVVVDNGDFCFVILEQEDDPIWGYTLHCYLENRTDKTLMFTWDDVSVNGFMASPYWGEEVAPGMRSYNDVIFPKTDFEKNGITQVEQIEYTMRAYDSDDWLADDIFNETMTYTP